MEDSPQPHAKGRAETSAAGRAVDAHMRSPGALYIFAAFMLPVWLIGTCAVALHVAILPLLTARWLLRRLLGPVAPPAALALDIDVIEHAPAAGVPRDVVFLIHGFPDCPAMWDPTVRALVASGYRCLVASLPGAQGECMPTPRSPQQLAEALHTALLRHEFGPVTLLTHDWGAAYGYLLAQSHPESVHRVIALDIGGHFDPRATPLLTLLSILEYQSFLALSYYMAEPAGGFLLRAMTKAWRYPSSLRTSAELTPDMAHHYAGAIRSEIARVFSGERKPAIDFAAKVPTLFLYAAHKPFLFHSREWIMRVLASPGGDAVRMPCGHWITHDKPAETELLIDRWLEETEALLKPARCAIER
ncbi:Alpha/Beta hydrolase protein [Pavlovales sp. CCMP2436]|nr:Alpha/Beta hydrolase protein [Pavlovales sp. CCMP2436]